jgi:hypothetical protein
MSDDDFRPQAHEERVARVTAKAEETFGSKKRPTAGCAGRRHH